MQNIYTILFIVIALANTAEGQCVVNAGEDKTICGEEVYRDTIRLGGDIVIQGGIPPYTYTWSADYWISNLHLSASVFLDDTTSPTPKLIDIAGNGNSMTYYLKVSDSVGNSCIDSIIITFSNYYYSLGYHTVYINKGDSILITAAGIQGGIPPFVYQWNEPESLSDANSRTVWAKPNETTLFAYMVTDSVGCQSGWNDVIELIVEASGINVVERDDIWYSPNPADKQIDIKLNNIDNLIKELLITDMFGQIIFKQDITQGLNELRVDIQNIANGMYVVSLCDNNRIPLKQFKSLIIH